MNESTGLLMALAAGVLLGGFFFFGLLWTIRRFLSSRQPALWMLGSLLLRTGVVLAGFYYVSAGQWERMLLCLVGFLVARLWVTRLTARSAPGDHPPLERNLHAVHYERTSIADPQQGDRK